MPPENQISVSEGSEGSDDRSPLQKMGFRDDQIEKLPSVEGMFSIESLEQALGSGGWTPYEEVEMLIDLARNAPKPMERLKARKDLRDLIAEIIRVNQSQVTMTRRSEYTDEQGNRITDTVEFKSRYLGGHRGQGARSVRPHEDVDASVTGGLDGSFDAPDD